MVNTLQLLLTLLLLTPLVVGKPTDLVVVRTPLADPLEKDVAALLNIEQFDSMTLCLKFQVRQYNIFHYQWHLLMTTLDMG